MTFPSHLSAVCNKWRGMAHGMEGQEVAWATAEGLGQYSLTAADVPLVPDVLRVMRELSG